MAKVKVADYSSTANNNTDINSINIAEGCAPSGINDAIRTLMAQLKDWQSGAVAQDNTFNGAVTVSGAAVLSSTLAVTGAQTNNSSLTVTGALNANGSNSLGPSTFSGAVVMSSNLTLNGQSDVRFADSDSSNWVAFQAPATVASNVTWTLPSADGTSGQLLQTNGSGTLSWISAGNVVGPASATDNAIVRYDLTTGKLIQNSGVTIDDSNNVSGVVQLNATTVDATNLEVTNIKAKDGTESLKIADSTGVLTEKTGSTYYSVVSQFDVGTGASKIPLNQYLGVLAYEDTETPALDVGTGITTGTGTICRANGGLMGGIYRMTIIIDLTGLNSGGTAGDIIGVNGTALPCYIARLPAMTVLGGRMTCLETPAGGDTDIDLYAATEGTGVEDQAISALTETEIINAGSQTRGTVTYFSADPAANAYFYMVGQGTSNATYTAGRFLIEIFGVQ